MNPKLKIVIPIAAILIVLTGVYLAGNSILPGSIKSNYQNKNCEQVLSLGTMYTSIYPVFMADKSIPDLTKECALYSLAVEAEQKKNWQDAYNAYKIYNQSYPKGMFTDEVNEHSALTLTNQAKEQLANKKYNDAIENIKLILAQFGKTKTSAESTKLMADIYTTWAKDQRDANDFAKAEETLKTFSTWAQSTKENESIKSAQSALAQTYLDWGLSLQTKQQFEDAQKKFELAASTDPGAQAKTALAQNYLDWGLSLQAKQQFEDAQKKLELATSTDPQSASGPGAQAKTAQAKLSLDWGNALLTQNDIPQAIAHYQTAITLSSEKDQPAIQDQIAAAHLKLAENLTSKEDFLGALKEIEQAKTIAASDAAKTKIETAQTATYQAFSQSTGEQAQQAIFDAAEKICAHHQQPELPIFGLDTNIIHTYLYILPKGERSLTDTVNAKTPASLHYVACATTSTKSETMKNSRKTFYQTAIHGQYTVERITNFLDIQLYDINNKIIATQLFAGGPPPSWVDTWKAMDNNTDDFGSFSGTEPSLETISAWVAKYMK